MEIFMEGISKSFDSNLVLENVNFNLLSGEVHALMGENGAGKSTLMKVLTGVYERDNGKIFVDAKEVKYKHPKEAEKAGIVFIYQELNVLKDLTVYENIFMCKEITHPFKITNDQEMKKIVRDFFKTLDIAIDPSEIMGTLSIGQQQIIEVVKALMADAKVIIMDEPTAALTLGETKFLFETIKKLKKDGVSIVYISHRMEEIFELCDRITILRDGKYIDTKKISETDMNDVVKMMIGREIGERFPKRELELGEIVFSVSDFTDEKQFRNISFDVRAGEVLGVSGLMGAGRSEIMNAIFGRSKILKGKLKLNNKNIEIKSPIIAKKLGLAYITEDRKSEGLVVEHSILDNINLANFDKITTNKYFIKSALERELSKRGIAELNIKCFNENQLAKNLSGGNQQKVVFAKWVFTDPQVLILDEPTRGVDIAAKKEIYTIINNLASKGVAVIMVSSELPEVLGMSDRIMVIHEGRLAGILDKTEANQETVMILATGGSLDE